MKIRIYNGKGVSKESLEHCLYTLTCYTSNNYLIDYIASQEIIESEWQQDTQLLVLPGGRDIYYAKALENKGNKQIQKFLRQGGNFLGMCAGAYYSGNYLEFAKSSKIEVIEPRELGKYKGRTHSADKTIRAEYVKMMQTGNYPVFYIAKMAKVSRQTLYNWPINFASA